MTTTPAEALSVLLDPLIAAPEGFIIRRFTVTVDADGMGVTTFTDIPAEGAVVPEGALGVNRNADSETQGSGIEVYTNTMVQTGDAAAGRIADNIIYNGSIYEVTSQDDYLQWGLNCAKATLASPGGRAL